MPDQQDRMGEQLQVATARTANRYVSLLAEEKWTSANTSCYKSNSKDSTDRSVELDQRPNPFSYPFPGIPVRNRDRGSKAPFPLLLRIAPYQASNRKKGEIRTLHTPCSPVPQ